MSFKKTNFFVSAVLLATVIPFWVNIAHGSDGSVAGGVHRSSIDQSVSVFTQSGGEAHSIYNLPSGMAFDPLEDALSSAANGFRSHSFVTLKPNGPNDNQILTTKSSIFPSGGITEDHQLFFDETASRLPALVDFSTDVEFGDVDNDGDLDIVLTNTDGGRNRLLINDGDGIFTDETSVRLPADSDFSLGLELGDVDGDDDLDIFVANNFAFQVPNCTLLSGQNRLLINNGEGVFFDETELRLPISIAASTDAKFVDTDGDGHLDIIVTNSIRPENCLFVGGGQIQLLINDGHGFFIDGTDASLPIEFHSDVSVDFGDIDGDDDFDILVATPYGQDRLLVNNGSGVFTDQSGERLPLTVGSTRCVVFFDADDDGDLDIFCANDSSSVWPGQTGAQNRLLINNGLGIFIDETSMRLPVVFDLSMGGGDFGDVDGDGDLDVIVANNKLMSEGRQNRLLINAGSGVFSDETVSGMPVVSNISTGVKFGDVDGDGDLDAIVVNYGQQNRLLIGKYDPKGGPPDPQGLKGDVNGDGGIDILDVLAAVNHILSLIPLTEDSLLRADCNGDGQINILDALSIVNVILGLGECRPGGCKAELTPEAMQLFKSLEPYLSAEDFARFMAEVNREVEVPVEYSLFQNYPNPFNLETRIDYELPLAGRVTLTIFNALGRRVRALVDGEQEAGLYTQGWDGCDDSGQQVASGVYFYQLKAGHFISSKKMLLIK